MTCASCVRLVERSLSKVEGIDYVSVNLATEKAYVLAQEDLPEKRIEEAVRKAGYGFTREKPGEDPLKKKFRTARINMILSLAVTVPLMVLMIVHMTGLHIPYFVWAELFLAAFVFVYPGRGIFKSAWIAGIHLHTNMDTLVSLGAVSAWTTALLAILGVDISSFGSIAAMIVAFHLTGRYIEARLKRKASVEIRELMELQARSARVVGENGEAREVPIESVKEGSVILVRTGERVPLDGVIREGDGRLDESMVTGESAPVKKGKDDEVIGGSLLNSGFLRIEITKTGDDTFLAQMIKLVEEAQSARVPIQATADRITKIFVPVVFSLAAAAGLFWGLAFENMQGVLQILAGVFPWVNPEAGAASTGVFAFVATLVIACPCALGLATPMALVAGSGAAARRGLIIRSGDAIQTAKDLEIIILDKTGTLTYGEPKVVETDLGDELIAAAAAIEANSNHPLARAVVDCAEKRGLLSSGSGAARHAAVTSVEETAGRGIEAEYGGSRFFVGRPEDPERYRKQMEKGYTVIELAKETEGGAEGPAGAYRPAGFFAIADRLKETSAEAVENLKKAGYTPVMITGDHEKTAAVVAEQAGVEIWAAGVRPEEKVGWIRKYQKQGKVVAMIGDGINDAAALKSADLGIAIGTGTDLAIENADMVIVQGDLRKVLDAILISRATFKKIRQNLFWAFFYNVVAIPLAMSGVLYPAIAEGAMMFSSINVILNSLGIKKRIKKVEVEGDIPSKKVVDLLDDAGYDAEKIG